MEAKGTNERGVFCPRCAEVLRVDWQALPPPSPSQNGSGWWLSCGHCQHKWWVPCPSSPEYQESLKKLKALLAAFDRLSCESPDVKTEGSEKQAIKEESDSTIKKAEPCVQVLSEERSTSSLVSLLDQKDKKGEDPFAAFQSLSFADWLEGQKKAAFQKDRKTQENKVSRQGKPSEERETAGPAVDATSLLTKEDLQDLKTSLLQALRDELAQVAKQQATLSAKMRDPRNQEILENKKGSDFFPKKFPKRTTKNIQKSTLDSVVSTASPASLTSSVSSVASLPTASETKGESFWLRFRRHLTLKPSSNKSLVGWDEDLPYLAPVLPMGASSKPTEKLTSLKEGQVIPVRFKREPVPSDSFSTPKKSRWRLFQKKGTQSKTILSELPEKGELLFPKAFQKKTTSAVSTARLPSDNDLNRLLFKAEQTHQKRKKGEESVPLSSESSDLSPKLPTLSETGNDLPDTGQKGHAHLNAKAKLGLTLLGTGILAGGALFLTVHYEEAARNLWQGAIPLKETVQESSAVLDSTPRPKDVAPAPETPSDQVSQPPSNSRAETEPTLKSSIVPPTSTEVPADEKLVLERVSYTLSKAGSGDEALVRVTIMGEMANVADDSIKVPPVSVTIMSEKWPGRLLYSGRYVHNVEILSSRERSPFQFEKSLPITEDEDLKVELSFSGFEKEKDETKALEPVHQLEDHFLEN